MITKLLLENYRAFEEVSADFSKINLFFGPNNSGKSSFLSAINVLSQTVQSPDSEIPILLSGKYEELGTYSDMVYSNDISKNIRFSIQAQFTITDRFFSSLKSPRVQIAERALHKYWLDIVFRYMKLRHEIVLEKTAITSSDKDILISTKRSKRLGIQRVDYHKESIRISPTRDKEPRMINFIPAYSRPFLLGKPSKEHLVESISDIGAFTSRLHSFLSQVEYVGPFRSYPERFYLYSGESPSSVGKRGNKAIEILVADEKRRGRLKKGLTKQLSAWLKQAQIALGIEVFSTSDRHFEILVENIETREMENLADAGFGCSQILPILIAGLNCEPGNLLIIQQPEIHLHPRAQAELGTFLYSVAKRGVQIIVETHSEHLLLRLQSHVAAKELNPEDVCVYSTDTNKNNKKYLLKLPVGEDGIFVREWPKGFFPERLEEAKKLAKLSLR